MACIIKQPVGESKGVLVVTDAELRDWLTTSKTLRRSFLQLKRRWLFLVHCNSSVQQTHCFDELVDAYIAGPGDIIWNGQENHYQIEMDCSNFCPDFFENRGESGEVFWDLLFVSRNQKFKSIGELFRIIRGIFDSAPLRVLAIISEAGPESLVASEPIRLYTSMFTEQERKHFTLLSPWVDYPFSFDLPTLAHFYKHSRMFLHTAEHERHPRAVGYAWASGIPVIAPRSAAALLPRELAKAPGFFSFESATEAQELVRQVAGHKSPLPAHTSPLPAAYKEFHLARHQVGRFAEKIRDLYAHLGLPLVEGKWFLANLDMRLARHHDRRAGTNSSRASLYQLGKTLALPLPSDLGDDPELDIDKAALVQPDEPAVERERRAAQRTENMQRLRNLYRDGGLRSVARSGARRLGRIARDWR
jgi:hypothetical protein